MSKDDPFFFWAIVPPILTGEEKAVEELAGKLEVLAKKMETEEMPSGEDQDKLEDLLEAIEGKSADKCMLAGAPKAHERADFDVVSKEAYEDEGGEAELDEPFEVWVKMFRDASDCENCPKAQIYGHEGLDPCELTPMVLNDLIRDVSVLEKVQYEMDTDGMADLAGELKRLVAADEYEKKSDLDEQDFDPKAYLEEMIRFLEFWSSKGCRVVPVFLDALEEEMDDDHDHG
jgi:hypothetical protein